MKVSLLKMMKLQNIRNALNSIWSHVLYVVSNHLISIIMLVLQEGYDVLKKFYSEMLTKFDLKHACKESVERDVCVLVICYFEST